MNAFKSTLVTALLLLSTSALADTSGLAVATKAGVGRCLVNGEGMTLYVFKKDAPGQSACQGECLARWPVHFSEGTAPAGLKAGDLGSIVRADGKKQSTYRGMPLYTFAADTSAADAKGHGVKDVWSVAAP
jgi:predicted lipoprotein with Yx(FWY)xxD motif